MLPVSYSSTSVSVLVNLLGPKYCKKPKTNLPQTKQLKREREMLITNSISTLNNLDICPTE